MSYHRPNYDLSQTNLWLCVFSNIPQGWQQWFTAICIGSQNDLSTAIYIRPQCATVPLNTLSSRISLCNGENYFCCFLLIYEIFVLLIYISLISIKYCVLYMEIKMEYEVRKTKQMLLKNSNLIQCQLHNKNKTKSRFHYVFIMNVAR